MERRIVLLAVLHSLEHGFVFKEHAVADVLGDLDQHLIHNAACADVGVTYFAVAHLAVRKTYVLAGSADSSVGILRHKAVNIGRTLRKDGVGGRIIFSNAKAVHDDKGSRGH